MKCQNCEKPATFHITELTNDEVMALHFCADCAEIYLKKEDTLVSESSEVGGMLAKQFKVSQTADELARLDKKACPVCGTTFFEFRQSGRLGCPHDYEFFAEELEPLMLNIHGATEHYGKTPKNGVPDPEHQAQLIRLRREMKEAVENEDYESASSLRDRIKDLQSENFRLEPTKKTNPNPLDSHPSLFEAFDESFDDEIDENSLELDMDITDEFDEEDNE